MGIQWVGNHFNKVDNPLRDIISILDNGVWCNPECPNKTNLWNKNAPRISAELHIHLT